MQVFENMERVFCLRSKRPQVRILSGAPHNSFRFTGVQVLSRLVGNWPVAKWGRTSPLGLATATATVSAWTTRPARAYFRHWRPTPFAGGSAAQDSPLRGVTRASASRWLVARY